MGGVIARTASGEQAQTESQHSHSAIDSHALLACAPTPSARACLTYAPQNDEAKSRALVLKTSSTPLLSSGSVGPWRVSRDVLVHVLSSFFVMEHSRDPKLLSEGYKLLQLCKWSAAEQATMKQRMGHIERQSDWTVARGGRQPARSFMEVQRGPFSSRYTWWQPVESRVPASLFPLRWKVKYKVRVCEKANGEPMAQPQVDLTAESEDDQSEGDDDDVEEPGQVKVEHDWALSLDKDELEQAQQAAKERASVGRECARPKALLKQ